MAASPLCAGVLWCGGNVGEALRGQHVDPYKCCTAHAWIGEVPAAYFDWPDARRRASGQSKYAAGTSPIHACAVQHLYGSTCCPRSASPTFPPHHSTPAHSGDAAISCAQPDTSRYAAT
ncbi:hypothetical protein CF641_37215 [Burkholderia pseudomallei]|uniref:hypothetical protein n=1 Tax=Burkholderia pseudomallei TaxID=28450 RepID=UPI000CCF5D68|nr:hypothetical protein CF641_37215 [Burkholderia pseudomallei]